MSKESEYLCRYCQRNLTHTGTRGTGKNALQLCYCHHCESEQTFDAKDQPAEYSFMVGTAYCIHYWTQSKAFKIVEYKNGRPAKYVVEITLKEAPDHMTPSNMTEERVKCLVVFS